jgi:hypothetical protein
MVVKSRLTPHAVRLAHPSESSCAGGGSDGCAPPPGKDTRGLTLLHRGGPFSLLGVPQWPREALRCEANAGPPRPSKVTDKLNK